MLDSRTGQRWSAPRSASARGSGESRRIRWLRTLIAKGSGPLRREHLRYWPMSARAGALHCFLIDCSGSMLRGRQLALAKGLLRQLIHSAYQQRAEVAIVGFAGDEAKVHLAPTAARPYASKRVEAWLQPIRAGGATPFGRGVAAATRLLAGAARARPTQLRWLWLLTDGRSAESPARPPAADVAVVIDCEPQRVPLQRCRALAERWRAHHRLLADFSLEPSSEKTL